MAKRRRGMPAVLRLEKFGGGGCPGGERETITMAGFADGRSRRGSWSRWIRLLAGRSYRWC
jgi:hypothetical protein